VVGSPHYSLTRSVTQGKMARLPTDEPCNNALSWASIFGTPGECPLVRLKTSPTVSVVIRSHDLDMFYVDTSEL